MSRYLSHLAELTLNRVEPVQPLPVSRFETPVNRGVSHNNDLEEALESGASVPSEYVQPTALNAIESPAAQTVVTAFAGDQAKAVGHSGFMFKQSDLPGDAQKPFLNEDFASSDTRIVEQTNRDVLPFNKPVAQAFFETGKGVRPTDGIHAPVDRVREHFTGITHSEPVIREVAAPDANQKISKRNESLRPAPVKPSGIVGRSEQSTTGPNSISRTDAQSGLSVRAVPDATAAPTIQVSIGRIEIRATPGADKPTSKPLAAATTMSLDDYLNRRNGGKS